MDSAQGFCHALAWFGGANKPRRARPNIYKGGILNDKTIGVDAVKDLKKRFQEIQKQKDDVTVELKEQEQKLEREIKLKIK